MNKNDNSFFRVFFSYLPLKCLAKILCLSYKSFCIYDILMEFCRYAEGIEMICPKQEQLVFFWFFSYFPLKFLTVTLCPGCNYFTVWNG